MVAIAGRIGYALSPMLFAARPTRPLALPLPAWSLLAAGVGLLVPMALALWLRFNPALNATGIEAPVQHLAIVGGASALALALALLLVMTSAQIKHYRVLFLSFGFVAYGGFSTIHALTAPGLILPDVDAFYGIPGAAAYLALFFAAAFFALARTRAAGAISTVLPFLPIGWLVVSMGGLLIGFFSLAVYRTATLAQVPLASFPYSTAMAFVTITLFLYAAWGYLQAYAKSRLPLQLSLLLATLFLAEAQFIITISPVWSWSWWTYHLIAFAGIALALRSLLMQRLAGSSLRSLVEEGLNIGVSVEFEVQHVNALAALSAAIEARDNETAGHNQRVADLSVRIGRAMGLDNGRLRVLAHAGLLHDIGKLATPDAILHKPGGLTDEEMAIMKTHPLRGLDILAKLGKFEAETAAITAHHERNDGSGYPYGLVGDQIPMEARIIAVVDTYDAVVSDRPYRPGRSPEVAFAILHKERGVKLDAECVNGLFRVLAPAKHQWHVGLHGHR